MDAPSAARSERSTAARWLPLAVFVFSALLFADSARNGFAMDDRPLVVNNPLIRDLRGVPELFRLDYWAPDQRSGLYRPLVTTSYAIDWALGGEDPIGYHLVNVGLHAANAALVATVLLAAIADLPLSATAAFLFAAHAVHTEAVANVAGGRPELLAAFFALLSLRLYLARRGARVRSGWALAAASLVCFGLALLAKENSVTLLGVLFLVDWVFGERSKAGGLRSPLRVLAERLPAYAAYGLVVLGYLLFRSAAVEGVGLPPVHMFDNPLATLSTGWRIVNALAVGLQYLELLILPLHLSYDYSWNQIPLIRSVADGQLWLVLALVALGLGLVVWSARRSPVLFFGLGFALVTFSVVSNVVVPIGTILGERLAYLPSVGFCLAAALGVRALARVCTRDARAAGALFAAAMALLVGLHALRAFERARDWRTMETLWLHDVEVSPHSVKAIANAGVALLVLERPAEALQRFDEAIAWGVPAAEFMAPHHGAVFALLALDRIDEARSRYAFAKRHGSPLPPFELLVRTLKSAPPPDP